MPTCLLIGNCRIEIVLLPLLQYTLIFSGTLKEEYSLCVEIKPKCGFLPTSKFIDEGNAMKRSVTRLKMYQALKLHDRTPIFFLFHIMHQILEISDYDPLDMFSGAKDRVHKVIKALYNTSQINFGVFLNGSLVFGSLDGGTKSTNYMVGQDIEDALKHVIMADNGMVTEKLLELITEALLRSGLLDRLLEFPTQKRGDVNSPYDLLFLESTNQSFNYKVSFIDLDMKPLKKSGVLL
ncbi:unnamed protein product [Coffea canephora]|uniref:Inositol-pentakisphosphate 2-kinase n=1 Tax=Coffea canephora TaxID=49390 RepID=A0A068VAP2_COFCA|nr:unnamed protein product [Coffea canephora]